MDNALMRKQLVESGSPTTLEGVPCSVAGWSQPQATLTPACGGVYTATWETIARVMAEGGNFSAQDVWYENNRWLGDGVTPVPPALQAKRGS